MTTEIKLDQIFYVSEDVVVREIEGELIIVPIATGIGDMEDELYTMNDSGRAILNYIDGKQTLGQIAETLLKDYDAPLEKIEQDVLGLVNELVKRNMLISNA